MKSLFLDRLKDATVREVNRMRDSLQIDPEYQREGNIWDTRRRQLLVDSLINGFDVPKLYLRRFLPPEQHQGRYYDFAVIDGRQRLETIWGYLNDEFGLAPDFTYVDDPHLSSRLAGMRYSDLSLRHPVIASDLMGYKLDVITVETSDEDLIDDMFLRLNDGVPLNAAEKRNAYGGPIPSLSRELATHDFFSRCIRLSNRRYRFYEIATKFLFFEDKNGVRDTKKVYLDRFVRSNPDSAAVRMSRLSEQTRERLDLLSQIFGDDDYLLDTAGMISVYYLVVMAAMEDHWSEDLTRSKLVEFNAMRADNKVAASNDEAGANYDLLEFERFAQSPNDSIALRFRRDLILDFLGHRNSDPLIDD